MTNNAITALLPTSYIKITKKTLILIYFYYLQKNLFRN